jgi:thiol:disulfide interchange protein DsbA
MTMRLIHRLLAAASFCLIALTAAASPADPVEGVDYLKLKQAQATDSGKKIEVLEFFWYNCPHCFAFEPQLAEWAKKHSDTIVFKRVPVGFRESFIPQQKMVFALEAMGKLDAVHRAVFDAVHVAHIQLDKEDKIIDFVEKQGVDRKKFIDTFNSFGVQSKVSRVRQLQETYQIDSVPTIVIDGRYVTAPSMVGAGMRGQPEQALHAATLQVMDALIAKKK